MNDFKLAMVVSVFKYRPKYENKKPEDSKKLRSGISISSLRKNLVHMSLDINDSKLINPTFQMTVEERKKLYTKKVQYDAFTLKFMN